MDWGQIALDFGVNVVAGFFGTLIGFLVAVLIRDRIYYQQMFGNWKVHVTYGEVDLLPEGRTIDRITAKAMDESTAEESVVLKGVASPYAWFHCDLITEGRDKGLLTVDDQPKRFFGKTRTYCIDLKVGTEQQLLKLNDLAQRTIARIEGDGPEAADPLSATEVAPPPAPPPPPTDFLLLNFAHPLTPDQQATVEQLAGQPVAGVIQEPTQTAVDTARPLAAQLAAIVDGLGLSPDAWQSAPIVVNPPGYAPSATVLLAELHGRMGHFPTVIRLAPAPGSTPPRYETAELINLQAVRDAARATRAPTPGGPT